MKVLCSYCEKEGKQALLWEIEPLEDPRITHGVCPSHLRQLLERIQEIAEQTDVRKALRCGSMPEDSDEAGEEGDEVRDSHPILCNNSGE